MILSTFSLRSSEKGRLTSSIQSARLLTHSFCSERGCPLEVLLQGLCCAPKVWGYSQLILPFPSHSLAYTWCSPGALPYIQVGNALREGFPSVFLHGMRRTFLDAFGKQQELLFVYNFRTQTPIIYYSFSVHLLSVWQMNRISTGIYQTMKIWSYSYQNKAFYWPQMIQSEAVQPWKHSLALYFSWVKYLDLWNSVNKHSIKTKSMRAQSCKDLRPVVLIQQSTEVCIYL